MDFALKFPAPDEEESGKVHKGEGADTDHGGVSEVSLTSFIRKCAAVLVGHHDEGLFLFSPHIFNRQKQLHKNYKIYANWRGL